MKSLNELIGANSEVGSELLKINRRNEYVTIEHKGPIANYEQTGIENAADTILALSALNSTSDDPDNDVVVSIRNSVISHTKLASCCYLLERLDYLRNAFWEFGASLPNVVSDRLSAHEKQFFKGFSDAVAELAKDLDIDLGCDPNLPPSGGLLEVRGGCENVADANGKFDEVWTDGGALSLDPANVQLVERDPTIETLLRKGILEQADTLNL